MTRFLFACFVALVALAPLPFGSAPQLAEAGLASAIGLLAVAYAVTLPFARHDREGATPAVAARRTWWLVTGFALLVAWAIAQMLPIWPVSLAYPGWTAGPDAGTARVPLTPDTAAAGGVLMRLVTYALVFWLALQWGRDSARAHLLLWTLVGAGALYAVYGMVMQFGGFDLVLWWEQRVYSESLTGTFINRNHFATYCGMLGAAALLLLLRRAAAVGGSGLGPLARAGLVLDNLGRSGWAALAMSVLLFAAVALSTSRAGTLAAAVGFAAAFLAIGARPGARTWAWLGALLTSFVLGVVLAAASGLLDGLLHRLDPQSTTVLGGRPEIARATLTALAERPLTGSGLGSFPGLFEAARTAELAQNGGQSFLRAHNSYIELAAEAGWPAFALMQALLLGIAWRCWRGLRDRHHDWVYGAVALAAGTVAAVHAAFDFSLQIPGVGVTLAALLGLGVAQSWRHRSDRESTASK
ncbi:hypothetical protein AY599_21360 [Leptolyngbya valderiana BDU 20041]|nr:hypothetical protein AY599_21360 [Leptolyngbya valderiana BDU 20041]